jgi:hypothetical protein
MTTRRHVGTIPGVPARRCGAVKVRNPPMVAETVSPAWRPISRTAALGGPDRNGRRSVFSLPANGIPLLARVGHRRPSTIRPLSRTAALAGNGRNGRRAAVTWVGRKRNGRFGASGSGKRLFTPPDPFDPVFDAKRTLRPSGRVGAASSLLLVILDAAVERIGGPNLPRIRPNHQSISFRRSKESWQLGQSGEAGIWCRTQCRLGLFGLGGLLYSTGVIFHLWERLRFQNAIWHAFVLVAAGCHYGAVLDCLVVAPT